MQIGEIEYYKEDDCIAYDACLPPWGNGGIFRIYKRAFDDTTAQWKFLAPHSPMWEAIHQKIYRNYNATQFPEWEMAYLPPLPDVPSSPHPSRESYYLPSTPLATATYPRAAVWIGKQPLSQAEVPLIVWEDWWESSHGDGVFRYLHGVFTSEQAAQAYMEGKDKYYSLRRLTVAVVQDQFTFPDFRLDLFDDYKPEEVLKKLESALEGAGY